MDPINVMTSLVGLLGSAGKVGVLILAVKKSISKAPRLMDQVLSQVKELEISLSAVQSFLLGMSLAPKTRISMIRVEQLVATLTEAVLTFSELEALVTSISKDNGLPITTRLKFLWKEDVIVSIKLRLERHKSSLSLMLNIAQCDSDLEAEQSRKTLQSLIEELLTSNHEMSRRLRSIEENLETRSIMTSCFRNGNITEAAEDNDTNDLQHEIHLTRRAMMRYSLLGQNLEEDASQPGYHVDLGNSKVYRRTEQYESDVTFTSSAIRTHAWSIFSDMSLSEVSLISAIALPLHLDEISNQEWYTLGEPDNINSDASSQATGQLFKSSAAANVVPETVFSTARNWRRLASRSEYEGYRQSATEQRARLFRNRDRAANNGNTPSKGIGSPILRDPDATVERPVNSTTDISHQSPSKPEGIQMSLYKLVLLGDNNVGKTTLSIQLCLQHFVETYDPSIEDTYRKQVVIDGQACLLEVLDTAGQEEYTALRDQWIRDGEGFVLVYCIASRCSFNHIRRYHNQVLRVKESTAISPSYPGSPISGPSPQDYPLMLIGNNSHLVTKREVSTQEGHALARELGCGFVEASAKNCINVEKPFYDIVRQLRRQRLHARAAERRRQAYENQKGTPA